VRDRDRQRLNDFAIKLANVNGTGSASANSLLMQAMFRMGVPVSGKNLFPSNIQGLPTWYEIRVNRDGHTARALDYDLMVAMNSQTYARDVAEVRSGGFVLYDSPRSGAMTSRSWACRWRISAMNISRTRASGFS
jgi:2-oxoglutarate ferredoxin oxidoreductase subunit alpha